MFGQASRKFLTLTIVVVLGCSRIFSRADAAKLRRGLSLPLRSTHPGLHHPFINHRRRSQATTSITPPPGTSLTAANLTTTVHPLQDPELQHWLVNVTYGDQTFESVFHTTFTDSTFAGPQNVFHQAVYDPTKSSTARQVNITGTRNSQYYNVYNETVTFGNFTVRDVLVGLPKNDSESREIFGGRSVFGLQWMGSSIFDVGLNWLVASRQQKILSPSLFGLALGLDCQGDNEISIQGVNPSLYEGDIAWYDLFADNTLGWALKPTVGGKTIGNNSLALLTTAGVPTSTDVQTAKKIHESLGLPSQYNDLFGLQVAPLKDCKPVPFTIDIGNGLYNVTIDGKAAVTRLGDIGCISSLVGDGDGTDPNTYWVLGTTFFMSTYVALDYDNGKIGLARRVQNPNSTCDDPADSLSQTTR